jgi:hypothetical protein
MSETVITAIISAITAVIGSILSYLATRKRKGEKDEIKWKTKKGRYFRSTLVVLVIILVGGGIGIAYSIYNKSRVPPFKVVRNYDFEDSTINPWEHTGRDLEISDDYKYSGKKSLRLGVDLEPGMNDQIYLDISGPRESLYLAGCEAYVFIPKTEQIKDGELYGSLFGVTYDENHNQIYMYGDPVEIITGKWNRLMCSFSYKTLYERGEDDSVTFQSFDWKIHQVIIMLWSPEKSYRGSIYYDNVVLYDWL